MFPLFFDSDYIVMLRSFTIKAPPPCVLKKWCRAWQVWNKQHLKRRRTEFKWAEPKAVAEILFMQMKTEGWSFIFYSWGFMAFCLSCQGCVCVRAFESDCHLRPTHTYCTELTPDHSALEKREEHAFEGLRCKCVWLHTHMLWRRSCRRRRLSRIGGA